MRVAQPLGSFLSAAVLLGALLIPVLAAGERPAARVSDLAWLAGSWRLVDGETTIEEYWTRPSDNAMLGMGRTLRGGKTVFFEYLRIEARDDGIFYVAHPKARAGTDFKLTSLDGQEVVFENPQHDFPKRLRYRREADGSLTATTDAGGAESKELPQVFKYKRLAD